MDRFCRSENYPVSSTSVQRMVDGGWISEGRRYYISLNLCGHHWSKVIFNKCIENGISLIYMTELRKAVLGFFHLLFLLSTLKISLGVVLPKKDTSFRK